MFLEWNATKFTVRVAEMDREHQHLVGLMNKLHELYSAEARRAAQAAALDELAKYVVKHFADEEAYMQRIGFPGLDLHKRIHADLLAKVGVFASQFATTGQLTSEFFDFLKVWLKAHICGVDARYGAHVKAA